MTTSARRTPRSKSPAGRSGRLADTQMPALPPDLGTMPVNLEPQANVADEDRATGAEIRDGFLWLTLADRRRLGAPLSRFPGLADIAPDRLTHVELDDEGTVAFLPDVPEWVYLPALLGYPPD